MKWLVWLAGLMLWTGAVAAVVDDTPEDHYLRIYAIIQEADALNDGGQPRQALPKYAEAQAGLARFPTTYPGWNENIVRFRLNYLNSKLAPLVARFPAGTNSLAAPAGAQPKPGPEVAATASGGENATLVRDLQDEIRRIQADNQTLQAKLKEALSVQPSATDPREITRAEEKNRALQKENELLKISLGQEQQRTTTMVAPEALEELRKALADSQSRYTEQAGTLSALKSENELLKKRSGGNTRSTEAVSRTEKELQRAQLELASLQKQYDQLRVDKTAIERKVADLESRPASTNPAPSAKEMRKIDQLQAKLDRQEAAAKSAAKASEAKIDQLQKDYAKLAKEKDALVTQLARATEVPKEARAETKRIRELEQDLEKQTALARENAARIKSLEKEMAVLQKAKQDLESSLAKNASEATKEEIKKRQQAEEALVDLKDKLAKTEKQLAKQSQSGRKTSETEKELAALQARLQVLESKPVPYSAEELAALRAPEVRLVASASEAAPGPVATPVALSSAPASTASNAVTAVPPRKAVRMLPSGTGALMAAGRLAFAAHHFDEAEQKFLEVLRQDEKNPLVLENVAAAQIELKKLDEAEKNLQTALSVDDQDDRCLYQLGRVKYLRGRNDEALALLSRAAKLNSEDAELQNYLGIVLTKQGLRAQAEAAYRKAIQFQPGYGSAHNNLAMIYAGQTPPSLALARWHYQKALEAGHPRNPDLEKLLSEQK
jgi:Flp pilus assembly protein TadD